MDALPAPCTHGEVTLHATAVVLHAFYPFGDACACRVRARCMLSEPPRGRHACKPRRAASELHAPCRYQACPASRQCRPLRRIACTPPLRGMRCESICLQIVLFRRRPRREVGRPLGRGFIGRACCMRSPQGRIPHGAVAWPRTVGELGAPVACGRRRDAFLMERSLGRERWGSGAASLHAARRRVSCRGRAAGLSSRLLSLLFDRIPPWNPASTPLRTLRCPSAHGGTAEAPCIRPRRTARAHAAGPTSCPPAWFPRLLRCAAIRRRLRRAPPCVPRAQRSPCAAFGARRPRRSVPRLSPTA